MRLMSKKKLAIYTPNEINVQEEIISQNSLFYITKLSFFLIT